MGRVMSLSNYVKKAGKRLAGTWGRINHKRDMRAASKGVRRLQIDDDVDVTFYEDHHLDDPYWQDDILFIDEEPH